MPKTIHRYVERVDYPLLNSKKAVFFLTGYASKAWFFKNTYKQLHKMGYSVFSYEFARRPMLTVESETLMEMLASMQENINEEIAKLKKLGYTEFDLFGLSMGAVFCASIPKKVKHINKMILITMYGNCADQIWDNKLLRKMKRNYIAKGFNRKTLHEHYPGIEPLAETEKIAHIPTLLYASTEDRTILYSNTEQFIDKAKEIGMPLTVVTGTKGHITFIIKSLKDKKWIQFLEKLN